MSNKKMTAEEFFALYNDDLKYRSDGKKTFGLELELVLFGQNNELVPRAYEVVQELHKYPGYEKRFKWEFSAWQLEVTTRVHTSIDCLLDDLFDLVDTAQKVAAKRGWYLRSVPYLGTMHKYTNKHLTPISIEPRYHEYANDYPDKVDAMCRVAATHIHVGGSSFQEVVNFHDSMVRFVRDMATRHSVWICRNRLDAFTNTIYPDFLEMPEYGNPEAVVAHASEMGFDNYLNYHFAAVRLNHKYATAELRLCDATLSRSMLKDYLRAVYHLVN